MIPRMNIVAWSAAAPWPELRQVEQDLIISRALIDLFGDPVLAAELRFRGGTAINKLFFPKPLRYSEDIDLVRTTAGPIGPILDRIRTVLGPWLGRAAFDQSDTAPKLRFRIPAEDGTAEMRLKVEINTREIDTFDEPLAVPFAVVNPWFSGKATIATFTPEELLATKLRALLQRDKGRDLLDLAHALDVLPGLNTARVVECLSLYLARAGQAINRAEAEKRMFAKLVAPRFLTDIRPLLTAETAEQLTDAAVRRSFATVFRHFIMAMPGAAWAKTPEKLEKFDLEALLARG
ncbi:MAG TPA: nucleotidyl transferase AbiEii/AbiGii toxin family protein [Rhodospirillaceae bacterium]|nr:nucleotidyl transferase AbiEii/AbiGii toxin family protein [Rhodospirillaceae bacterium]